MSVGRNLYFSGRKWLPKDHRESPQNPFIDEMGACGEDVMIWNLAQIIRPEKVRIGNAVIIDDFTWIDGGLGCDIGDFVHIAGRVLIAGGGRFKIGDMANISGGAIIYTGSDDFSGGGLVGPTIPLRYRNVTRSQVIIENHAVIGAGAIILPGVTIGMGAAVGAGAVVRHDVPAWTIVAGNPACEIKARPRKRMLELAAQLCEEAYRDGHYIPANARQITP